MPPWSFTRPGRERLSCPKAHYGYGDAGYRSGQNQNQDRHSQHRLQHALSDPTRRQRDGLIAERVRPEPPVPHSVAKSLQTLPPVAVTSFATASGSTPTMTLTFFSL